VAVTLDLSFNGRMYCIRRATDRNVRILQKVGSELLNQYPKKGKACRTDITLVGNFGLHTIINLQKIRQRNPSKQ
jgi:hypothetical protein